MADRSAPPFATSSRCVARSRASTTSSFRPVPAASNRKLPSGPVVAESRTGARSESSPGRARGVTVTRAPATGVPPGPRTRPARAPFRARVSSPSSSVSAASKAPGTSAATKPFASIRTRKKPSFPVETTDNEKRPSGPDVAVAYAFGGSPRRASRRASSVGPS